MSQRRAERSGSGELPYRGELEQSFQQDLSSVEVQRGRGRELAQHGATAKTEGERIEFAEDQPKKEVVAHEVAHVVQNRRADASGGGSSVGAHGNPAEREADGAAAQAMAGQRATVREAPGGSVQMSRFKEGQNVKLKDGRVVSIVGVSEGKPKEEETKEEKPAEKKEEKPADEKVEDDDRNTFYMVSDAEGQQFRIASKEIEAPSSEAPTKSPVQAPNREAQKMMQEVQQMVNRLVSSSTSEAEKTIKLFRFLHDNAAVLARGKAERIQADFERLNGEFNADAPLREAMKLYSASGDLEALLGVFKSAPASTLKNRLKDLLPESAPEKKDEPGPISLKDKVEGLVSEFDNLASVLDTALILPFASEWSAAAEKAVPGLGPQPIVESMGDVLGGIKGETMFAQLSTMDMQKELPDILVSYLQSGQLKLDEAVPKLNAGAQAASVPKEKQGAPEKQAIGEGQAIADKVNQQACYPGRVSSVANATYQEIVTGSPIQVAVQKAIKDKAKAGVYDAQLFGFDVLMAIHEFLKKEEKDSPKTFSAFQKRARSELAQIRIKNASFEVDGQGYEPPSGAWEFMESSVAWEEEKKEEPKDEKQAEKKDEKKEEPKAEKEAPGVEIWSSQAVQGCDEFEQLDLAKVSAVPAERRAAILGFLEEKKQLTKDGKKYRYVGIATDHANWRLMTFKFELQK